MKSYIAAPVAIVALLFGVFSQDLRYLRFTTSGYQVEKSAPGKSTDPNSDNNCTNPQWSEWVEDLPCNSNCGACGTRILRRSCLSVNCVCIGEARREESCNIKVCNYPKAACCPPYRLVILDGHFVCGPQSETVAITFLKSLGAASDERSAEVDPILPSPSSASGAEAAEGSGVESEVHPMSRLQRRLAQKFARMKPGLQSLTPTFS